MQVLLFGITRDIVGRNSLIIPEEAAGRIRTVRTLKNYLSDQYPKLNEITSLAVAVNRAYAGEETVVEPQDDIALIPPVSGG